MHGKPRDDEPTRIADLPNLGPRSQAMLAAAGIDSVAQLRRIGAVAAFALARRAGPSASLNLLWAIEGALTGLPWQQVAREHRTSLLLALEQHEQGDAQRVARRRSTRAARSAPGAPAVPALVTCIALVRGVNVGRARRLAMADLRRLVQGLGMVQVRTLLNSGNVVFRAPGRRANGLARAIESAIERQTGWHAPVRVISADELAAIVHADPLQAVATDPARHLVAFVADPTRLDLARSLLDMPWRPEAFALSAQAAHLWCANGVAGSPLLLAFNRLTGEAATTRNWTTVLKLHAAAQVAENAA